MSSVVTGAVILGCGTGLPELALAFHRTHSNPLRQMLGLDNGGSAGVAMVIVVTILVLVLCVPTLFPARLPRHSPLILAATIAFAALLRGSLDVYEGAAMLVGFALGLAWIVRGEGGDDFDPFAPVIEDDYDDHGAYIEAPVMTSAQVSFTRCLIGLLGTGIGAQLFANSLLHIMRDVGAGEALAGIVFIGSASVLPHVVVAVQALKQHEHGLAEGNLIGSNLFQSLAIGGLVAVIRPYQDGGHVGWTSFVIAVATGALTYLLLHSGHELSRRQGILLVGAYVTLVFSTVP